MYERIPHICSWCGRLGHLGDECNVVKDDEKEKHDPGYGDWLLFRPPPKKTWSSELPDDEPKTPSAARTGKEVVEEDEDDWGFSGEEDNGEKSMEVETNEGAKEGSKIKSYTNPLAVNDESETVVAPTKFTAAQKGKVVKQSDGKPGLGSKRKSSDLNLTPNPKEKAREVVLGTGGRGSGRRGTGRGSGTGRGTAVLGTELQQPSFNAGTTGATRPNQRGGRTGGRGNGGRNTQQFHMAHKNSQTNAQEKTQVDDTTVMGTTASKKDANAPVSDILIPTLEGVAVKNPNAILAEAAGQPSQAQ